MKKFNYKKFLAYVLSASLFAMQLPMTVSAEIPSESAQAETVQETENSGQTEEAAIPDETTAEEKEIAAEKETAAEEAGAFAETAEEDSDSPEDSDSLVFETAEPDEEIEDELEELNSLSLEGLFGEQKDYVPEEILLTVRGGIQALYDQNTEKQIGFMEDFDFEVMNTFEDTGEESEYDGAAAEEVKSEDIEESSAMDIILVTCPGAQSKAALKKIVRKFEALKGVESASLNEVYSIEETSEDDFTDLQWGFLPEDENGVPSEDAHMGLSDTAAKELGEETYVNWNSYSENAGVKDYSLPDPLISTKDIVVAVLDTGIDTEHPDLKKVLWDEGENYEALTELGGGKYGLNAMTENSLGQKYDSTDVNDDNHHGTHVSGIIAAEWNGFGISGITSGAKILTVKAGNNKGQFPTTAVIKGFNYIITAKKAGVNIAVMNNSWGAASTSAIIDQYVKECAKLGIVVCFAAGNEKSNLDLVEDTTSYYSNQPNVVTVASHDADGRLSPFTNYGVREVHVSAPGGSIYSTMPRSMAALNLTASGTSSVKDGSGNKYEDRFSDTGSTFFNYTPYDGVNLVMSENEGYQNSGAMKAVLTREGFSTISLNYDLSSFDKLPESFGFAFKCQPPENTQLYAYAFIYYENGEKKTTSVSADYINKHWNTASLALPENLDRTGVIQICLAYLQNTSTYLSSGTFILDNIMFTNDSVPYGYSSGTSMASPAVAGEAALLMKFFHPDYADSDNQAVYAEDIAARIRGSVETFSRASDQDKIISKGYVRIDKALHGETIPVLSGAEYKVENGIKTAVIKGKFIDGVTLEGKTPAEPKVTIDGKEAKVLEYTGTSVTVDVVGCLGEENLDGEHEFAVTSVYGTGRKFMEMLSPADLFERLPVSNRAEMPELYTTQFRSLQAVNGVMYLLVYNQKNYFAILKQKIGSTDGLWEKTSSCLENTTRSGLTAYDRKLLFTEFPDDGSTNIMLKVYDPASDSEASYDTGLSCKDVLDMKLCYNGKYLLLMLTFMDNSSRICMLDPSTKKAQEDNWVNKGNKINGVITYDEEGRFYITDSTSTWMLTYDPNADTKYSFSESGLNYPDDKADGQSTLLAAAAVKNGILLTGIAAVNDAGTVTHDTYLLDRSDLTAVVQPTEKFVSESKLTNAVAAAYDGKYYVLARTEYADDYVLYACMNAETQDAPGDAAVPGEDSEDKSGNNSANGRGTSSGGGRGSASGSGYAGGTNGAYNLPSFVRTNAGWEKASDGSWSFTDADGKIIRNTWAAIAKKTYDSSAEGYAWFCFDENGKMRTGWFIDSADGSTYYMNPVSNGKLGEMVTGWQFIDNRWYYFRTNEGGPLGSLDLEKSIPDMPDSVQQTDRKML